VGLFVNEGPLAGLTSVQVGERDHQAKSSPQAGEQYMRPGAELRFDRYETGRAAASYWLLI
jgi:hypothetical protein